MPLGRPLRILAASMMGLVIIGAVTLPSSPAAAEGTLDRPAIRRYLSDYVDRHGLSGAQVALAKDGVPVYETGVGGATTARTPMAIASVSKVITAFAVLQLVDDERITLDDRVHTDLPEFALDDPRGSRITVRQLLSHTSGLPNPTLVEPAGTLRQRVAQLRTTELSSEPGTAYLYSNLGYHTAARLVEVVAGEPFEQYLDRHLFDPLGMQDTFSVVTKTDTIGLSNGHVTAYGTALPLREMAGMNAGSGGVISTAHDMSLFLAMLQRGGVAADGHQLLSEKLIKESFSRQPAAGFTGLGWQHTTTSQPARIGKDGSLTRYSARIDLVPGSGYAVAVLLNSYTPTFKHPFEISSGVIDIAEGRTAAPGAPVPTIIDAILGLITLAIAALTVRGLLRHRRWVERRREFPVWRITVRLLPQLIIPAAAAFLFLVLPGIKNNTATPLDVFGLWPAAMILFLVAAVAGLLLTTIRVRDFVVSRSDPHTAS